MATRNSKRGAALANEAKPQLSEFLQTCDRLSKEPKHGSLFQFMVYHYDRDGMSDQDEQYIRAALADNRDARLTRFVELWPMLNEECRTALTTIVQSVRLPENAQPDQKGGAQ